MGLFSWIQRRRNWHREHIAAFSAATQLESDGLSRFQHDALFALAEFVAPDLFGRVAMTKERGAYLVAELGESGAELYVYPNGASILGQEPDLRFEEWDYRTPEDLLAAVVQHCADRIAKSEGSGAH